MKYELVMNAEIRQVEPYRVDGNLRIAETIELQAADFMELCAILTEFHKLAENLKSKRR